MEKKNSSNGRTISTNKKARHDYFIIDTFDCGLVLNGCEIKSIRNGDVNITEGYCYVTSSGEVFIKNMYIKPYENGSFIEQVPTRDRKLLLTKREIRKLKDFVKTKGNTIAPLSLFINEHGFAKLKIATVKGKHDYDRREDIKERDIRREMERNM